MAANPDRATVGRRPRTIDDGGRRGWWRADGDADVNASRGFVGSGEEHDHGDERECGQAKRSDFHITGWTESPARFFKEKASAELPNFNGDPLEKGRRGVLWILDL